jgi:hypothetical protein
MTSEQIADALVRLRKLISGFNRSSKRKTLYFTKQAVKGLPRREPIHDEPTRWVSTYDMIDRFLEQQSAFCAVLADDRRSWSLMSADADITNYETLTSVLDPLSEFTDAVNGEKQVTISCVQPVLWKIFEPLTLKETDSALADEVKQVLLLMIFTRDTLMISFVCCWTVPRTWTTGLRTLLLLMLTKLNRN